MDEKVKIVIRSGVVVADAELTDSETGHAVGSILPITGSVNRWGDEIYFDIPLKLALAADARDLVEAGELGYWPDGRAFCIFFGKTPMSRGDEIRAASRVNIFGRIIGDATIFKTITDGAEITIRRHG
jgi:hypothetical protein